jgi:hypothetical protein
MEVTIETIYDYRHCRFFPGRLGSASSHRYGVGYHCQWHPDSHLGERRRLRHRGYTCVQTQPRNAGMKTRVTA